jgi:hypothetical protein
MRCYGNVILTIVLSVFDSFCYILCLTAFIRLFIMSALYYVYVVVMRNLFAAAVVTAVVTVVVSVVYVASVTMQYTLYRCNDPLTVIYVHTLLVHTLLVRTYTPSTHIHTSPVPTCTHVRTHTSFRTFIIHTTEST